MRRRRPARARVSAKSSFCARYVHTTRGTTRPHTGRTLHTHDTQRHSHNGQCTKMCARARAHTKNLASSRPCTACCTVDFFGKRGLLRMNQRHPQSRHTAHGGSEKPDKETSPPCANEPLCVSPHNLLCVCLDRIMRAPHHTRSAAAQSATDRRGEGAASGTRRACRAA